MDDRPKNMCGRNKRPAKQTAILNISHNIFGVGLKLMEKSYKNPGEAFFFIFCRHSSSNGDHRCSYVHKSDSSASFRVTSSFYIHFNCFFNRNMSVVLQPKVSYCRLIWINCTQRYWEFDKFLKNYVTTDNGQYWTEFYCHNRQEKSRTSDYFPFRPCVSWRQEDNCQKHEQPERWLICTRRTE